MDNLRLINEIIKSSKEIIRDNQAIIYKFYMNGKTYCLKHYYSCENYEGIFLEKLNGYPEFPKVFEWGHYNGSLYIIMEWIEGERLDKLNLNIESKEKLKDFFIEILDVLKDNFVNHSDIRTENIIYNGDDFKLIDFGVAYSNEYPRKSKVKEINPKYGENDEEAIKKLCWELCSVKL